MRIGMIVSAAFPPREGMGFYIWNLARHLTRQGHQVHIITRGSLKRTWRERVDGLTIWRPTFAPIYPLHVHGHNLFVQQLANRLESELDLWHLHTPLVKLPTTTKPVLVTVHTPMKADAGAIPVTNWLGVLIRLQAPFSYRLERELFDRADGMTAVAHSVADELQVYGVDPQQVAVMGNGVDTEVFYPSEAGPETAVPYLLTVGRLAPRKGLHDLIRCAEQVVHQFPHYRFLIAGDGPLAGELLAEIARCKLADHVILLGHIAKRARLVALYQGATAYIHAAHYEGLPTTLLEAMACGRPVVATAISGTLDVVQDGHNGLLIPPREPAQIAATLTRLLQSPDFARQLGTVARRTITERYAWPIVSRNYVTQYEALLQGVTA